MQQTLKKILQSAAFATFVLAGCTRVYKCETYYDYETGIEHTTHKEQTLEEKIAPESFEDILAQHNYTVFKIRGEGQNPVKIIADFEHTSTVKEKNNALLKDILTQNNILLVEGYVGGIRYPDLEERLFAAIELPQQAQTVFKQMAEEGKGFKDTEKSYSYWNQEFPCDIESSDDDVLAYVSHSLYQDVEELDNQEFESTPSLRAQTIINKFNQALHHRNLAITRTIKQKLQQNPTTNIYQVIGAHHAITNTEIKKVGSKRFACFEQYSGDLCKLLEAENIPYIIIIQKDFFVKKD